MHRVCVNRPHCTSQAHHAGCIHSAYLMVGGFAQYPSTRKALTNALHVSDSVPQQGIVTNVTCRQNKIREKKAFKASAAVNSTRLSTAESSCCFCADWLFQEEFIPVQNEDTMKPSWAHQQARSLYAVSTFTYS